MQEENRGGESLVIDVENYRYELGIRYRQDKWLARLDLPFVSNSAGKLDGAIDDWHKFFGLPEGKRDEFPRNELNIDYQRDGACGVSAGQLQQRTRRYRARPSVTRRMHDGCLVCWNRTAERRCSTITAATKQSILLCGSPIRTRSARRWGHLPCWASAFPVTAAISEGLVVDRIWVAQAGFDYRFNPSIVGTLQFDLHSQTIEHSELESLW